MRNFLIFGMYVLLTLKSSAQDTLVVQPINKASFDKKYFKSFLCDGRDLVTEPFHWKNKDWFLAAGVTCLALVAVNRDENVRDFVLRNRNDKLDPIVRYGVNPIGNLYSYSFLALFYVNGLIVKNERTKKTAMEAVKALVFTSVFTQAVKRIVQRERPYENVPVDADDSFNFLEGDNQYASFFSGHTSTAFCLATIFAKEYKEKNWVPYVSYGLAGAAGLGRMYLDKHWSSDVLVGAAVGYYMANVIHKKNNWRINVEPFSSGKKNGMRFSYLF